LSAVIGHVSYSIEAVDTCLAIKPREERRGDRSGLHCTAINMSKIIFPMTTTEHNKLYIKSNNEDTDKFH
jgi:hypothetical protein